MSSFSRILPLLAVLIAAPAPALAAEPDIHADHATAKAADPGSKAATEPDAVTKASPAKDACPMMESTMGSAAGSPKGKMMGDGMKGCMSARAPKPNSDAPADHDHPKAAPK